MVHRQSRQLLLTTLSLPPKVRFDVLLPTLDSCRLLSLLRLLLLPGGRQICSCHLPFCHVLVFRLRGHWSSCRAGAALLGICGLACQHADRCCGMLPAATACVR